MPCHTHMPLLPYRSFFDMDRFFDEEFPIMTIPSEMRPSMDIYEKGSNVIAEMHVPGIDADKIEVSVKDGILHVFGISENKKEEKDKGYWRKEIRRGSFERLVRLPVAVKEEAIQAVCENGTLVITMPKLAEKSAKKVQVKVKKTAPKKITKRT